MCVRARARVSQTAVCLVHRSVTTVHSKGGDKIVLTASQVCSLSLSLSPSPPPAPGRFPTASLSLCFLSHSHTLSLNAIVFRSATKSKNKSNRLTQFHVSPLGNVHGRSLAVCVCARARVCVCVCVRACVCVSASVTLCLWLWLWLWPSLSLSLSLSVCVCVCVCVCVLSYRLSVCSVLYTRVRPGIASSDLAEIIYRSDDSSKCPRTRAEEREDR